MQFDARAHGFRWDVSKIRAKNLSDNVVDLMIGKLRRLPRETQVALQRLACFGHFAPLFTLEIVLGGSETEVHERLWEAVGAGLAVRVDGGYRFLHDRVQEAAYALEPESERARIHLGIARLLSSRLSPEQVA